MTAITATLAHDDDVSPRYSSVMPVGAWLSLALIVPMFVSGLVFRTYDIAVDSLAMEVLRQLNTPFVLAEIAVIVWAMRRGFRLRTCWLAIPPAAKLALGVFGATFWIGGLVVSKVAPFATLFNLTYLLHIACLGAVAYLAASWRCTDTQYLTRIVAMGLAGFMVTIAIAFLMPPAGRALDTITWQFAIPGFISVRLLGAMAGTWAAFFVCSSLLASNRAEQDRWLLAATALASGLMIWTGTRAAVLGCVVAGMLMLVHLRRLPRRDRIVKTVLAVTAGALIAITLLPYDDSDFRLFLSQDFQGGADTLASGRLQLWAATWQAFTAVPLTGAGPGASAWMLSPEIFKHIQPHNIVLQFLLHWGSFAAVAALALVAMVTAASHRKARRWPEALPFVLAADSLLVMGFLDGTFHFAQHLMLWVTMSGIALGIPAASQRIDVAKAA